MPIADSTLETARVPALLDVLKVVPDPRSAQGRRHPLPALLASAVAAMLAGCRSVEAIAQWVRAHGSAAELLGFTDRRPPCPVTFHYVFKRLDVAAFEVVVSAWLCAVLGESTPLDDLVINLDGKALRGSRQVGLPARKVVSAYADRLGAGIAQVEVARDTNEHKAALELLHILPLEGTVVTGDAAYTQRDICEAIRARGGDYYLRVKSNQPALLEEIEAVFAGGFSPRGTAEMGR